MALGLVARGQVAISAAQQCVATLGGGRFGGVGCLWVRMT